MDGEVGDAFFGMGVGLWIGMFVIAVVLVGGWCLVWLCHLICVVLESAFRTKRRRHYRVFEENNLD